MPGFRGPRNSQIKSADTDIDTAATTLLSEIFINDSNGHSHNLATIPIQFGQFESNINTAKIYECSPLYNNDVVFAARAITTLDWAVYAFNTGHFVDNFTQQDRQCRVVLAADPYLEGRSCFSEFTDCKCILSGAADLLNHIRSSGDSSLIDGYIIHSHQLPSTSSVSKFWQLHATIITELHKLRGLSMFIAFLSLENDSHPLQQLDSSLSNRGWIITCQLISFPAYGDSVSGNCKVMIGVHSQCDSSVQPINIPNPPTVTPSPLSHFLWKPFNRRNYALSFSRSSKNFGKSISDSISEPDSTSQFSVSEPKPGASDSASHKVLYCLHPQNSDQDIQQGYEVCSTNHISKPWCPSPNDALFKNLYGIEFHEDGDTFVRQLSPFEFARCFQLHDDITYKLSHGQFQHCFDCGIPSRSSLSVLSLCCGHLSAIRDANIEIFDPRPTIAPAAMCPAFINGAVGTRLPDVTVWKQAYSDDPETCLIRDMINNPAKVVKENLIKVHHTYRMPEVR
eukprot:scaffold30928_cov30-Cyclotella_meneghiniana.AAC.3